MGRRGEEQKQFHSVSPLSSLHPSCILPPSALPLSLSPSMNQLLAVFDQEFSKLHARSVALICAVPADRLYWQPRAPTIGAPPVYSCGEHIIRSAAVIEQTFGGLTANLWDDPFEWTLPESLAAPERMLEYLSEVEATRRRGFSLLKSDDDLYREIAMPSGEMLTLFALLTETLVRAAQHQGCADAIFRLISDVRLPE